MIVPVTLNLHASCGKLIIVVINISEIRAGNWVSTAENSWGIVKSIGKTIMVQHALEVKGYFPELLFPIKINLDLITPCGFQPHNAMYKHKKRDVYLKYYGTGDVAIATSDDVGECSFMHQLQNLYFDVTGERLEPNLFGN
jgi:hypothetical protein